MHALGNLTVLAGPNAFNGYGAALRGNPLVTFVEAYLALAFVVHAAVGLYNSWLKVRQWWCYVQHYHLYGQPCDRRYDCGCTASF